MYTEDFEYESRLHEYMLCNFTEIEEMIETEESKIEELEMIL